MMDPHRRFLVRRQTDGDDTAKGDLLGWGCEFPNGPCIVDWRLEAFPEEDRLDHGHESRYGSLKDVKQGTGGTIHMVDTGETAVAEGRA